MKRISSRFRIGASKVVCAILWGWGLTAQGATPVVFLHGWNSDGGIWDDLCYLLSEKDGYSYDDFRVWDYYAWRGANGRKFDTDTPIEEIAAEAGRRISEIAADIGGKVDVVAHSMGGLVVRAALTYGCLSPDVVGHFITLGTPHYGELVGLPYFSNGFQTHQMAFGSSFLWDLATDWHFRGNRIARTLCIAGVEYSADDLYGLRTDGLVPACSAALSDCPCLWVKRYHASVFSLFGKVLYQCEDGVDDPVYRAVSAFLTQDRVLTQDEVGWKPNDDSFRYGALFYQIVDAQTRVPYAYGSKTSNIAVGFRKQTDGKVRDADASFHGGNDVRGTKSGVEMAVSLSSGTFDVAFADPAGKTFWAKDVEVVGGHVNVLRIASDGTFVDAFGHVHDVAPESSPDPSPVPAPAVMKATTMLGAVVDADGSAVGIVQLKVGKSDKRGVSKVTATVIGRDGGKSAAKAVNVSFGGGQQEMSVEVKNHGLLALKLGVDGFTGTLGTLTVVSGNDEPADGPAAVALKFDEALPVADVLTEYLPTDVVVQRTAKKWTLPKAGKLKYVKANPKKGIEAHLEKTGDNISGLKLTYAAKTQTVKGSFKIWTFDAAKGKLKSVSASVTGVVVDGVAYCDVSVKKQKIGELVVK